MNIFISYARKDQQTIKLLAEEIEAMGHSVWLDVHLEQGKEWYEQLLENIQTADVLIAALSDAYFVSEYCRKEYEYAEEIGKELLPVNVSSSLKHEMYKHLPEGLAKYDVVDFGERTVAQRKGLKSALDERQIRLLNKQPSLLKAYVEYIGDDFCEPGTLYVFHDRVLYKSIRDEATMKQINIPLDFMKRWGVHYRIPLKSCFGVRSYDGLLYRFAFPIYKNNVLLHYRECARWGNELARIHNTYSLNPIY